MNKTVFALVAASFLVACGGTEGPPGPKGDTGPAGPGLNSTIRYFCTDGSDDYHEIWKWPDGSVMTTCQIAWSGDGQTTAVSLWRSDQLGAAAAFCLVGASGPSYAEFRWNGGTSSTQTIFGATTQTYNLPCIQQ